MGTMWVWSQFFPDFWDGGTIGDPASPTPTRPVRVAFSRKGCGLSSVHCGVAIYGPSLVQCELTRQVRVATGSGLGYRLARVAALGLHWVLTLDVTHCAGHSNGFKGIPNAAPSGIGGRTGRMKGWDGLCPLQRVQCSVEHH